MSGSGIEVSPEVKHVYESMKSRKAHKYAIFHVFQKKIVNVELKSEYGNTSEDRDEDGKCFEELLEHLLEHNEPRYIIYDFGFKPKGENEAITLIAFIVWIPESAKIGNKMIYLSSKDSVKKSLPGISIEFQVNQPEDMDYDQLADTIEKKYRAL